MKKWECMVCGYIHEGETPPEECPLCGASSDQFEELVEKETDVEQAEETETETEAETEAVEEKTETGPVKKWRCTLCGYIHEGPEPPDECPICGASSEAFEEVVEEEKHIIPQLTDEETVTDKSGRMWRCKICGYIHEGDAPPDKCPLCGAGSDQFEEVVEGAEKGSYTVKGKKEKASKESFLVTQIIKHHLHPIIVHTPNGVLPVGLVFIVLALLFKNNALFDTVAFYNNIFVLVSMPAVLATGIIVWKKRYNGALTILFKIKIAASVLVTLLLAGLVVWRAVEPQVLFGEQKWIYLGLSACMVAFVGLAGHMGGKLVFGGRE